MFNKKLVCYPSASLPSCDVAMNVDVFVKGAVSGHHVGLPLVAQPQAAVSANKIKIKLLCSNFDT
jgi:hypothetical protein